MMMVNTGKMVLKTFHILHVHNIPASILRYDIRDYGSDRYQPDRTSVGPMTVRYELKQNAGKGVTTL